MIFVLLALCVDHPVSSSFQQSTTNGYSNVSTCGINMFCSTLLVLMMIYPCVYVWYKLVASLSTCAKKLFIKSPSEKAPPSTKRKKTKDEANNVTTFFLQKRVAKVLNGAIGQSFCSGHLSTTTLILRLIWQFQT